MERRKPTPRQMEALDGLERALISIIEEFPELSEGLGIELDFSFISVILTPKQSKAN